MCFFVHSQCDCCDILICIPFQYKEIFMGVDEVEKLDKTSGAWTMCSLQRYSQSHSEKNHWQEWNAPAPPPPKNIIPAGSSHSQPMDTFLLHRNYTSRSHATAGNRKADSFVNYAVKSHHKHNWLCSVIRLWHFETNLVSVPNFIQMSSIELIEFDSDTVIYCTMS